MVIMPSLGHGHLKYWGAATCMERVELHRLIYDPKDLVEALEDQTPWSPVPQDALVPLSPHVSGYTSKPQAGGNNGKITGMAFDPQTRILYVTQPRAYKIGLYWYPIVHGWHIK